MGRSRLAERRLAAAALGAFGAVLLVPAVALAHPLGNFTINHYAGLRVSADRVAVDLVIDRAEIPAFQEIRRIDTDGDGEIGPVEAQRVRESDCRSVAKDLSLTVSGATVPLRLWAAGVSFPPGVNGLSTMRLVCELDGELASPLVTSAPISFEDRSFAQRIGWREITVEGDGATVTGDGLASRSVSARLTSYPQDLIAEPLSIRSVTFSAAPGGPTLAPFRAPEVFVVEGQAVPGRAPLATSPSASPEPTSSQQAAAVPGGVGAEIPDIFRRDALDPAIVLLALATAAVLGAGHALTPGHGKSLMAAYLVGTRGSVRHAFGLGLSVSASHTIGILGLAILVVSAQQALPPDVVQRALPVVAAASIVAIGGWMLFSEGRRLLRRRAARLEVEHSHVSAHAQGIDHDHGHAIDDDHGHDHQHSHDHDGLEHSHGGVRHRHLPAQSSSITWRGLFAIGLAGGLVPSTNALLILLATIAAGRPLYGLILIVAFGLGMAAVMTSVGLALVFARSRIDRLPSRSALGRVTAYVPLGAAVVVLAIGVVLTTQAIVGRPVL